MDRRSKALLATISSMACAGAANVAAADNSLGFYAGGGIGYGAPQNAFSQDPFGSAHNVHTFGWDALVGIQPTKWAGAEVQYLDFGHLDPQATPDSIPLDAHNFAVAAFAVGHLSLPYPWLDLFGKVGASQLWADYSFHEKYYCNDSGVPCDGSFRDSETDLAYGGGAQVRFGAFAARLEYVAIDAKFGTPSLISVGVTWTP